MIGGGWAGATATYCLRGGADVHIFEALELGGHSNASVLSDIMWEPHGPHIFHTTDAKIVSLVQSLGMTRPFVQKSLTNVYLHEDDDNDDAMLLSWPRRVDVLRHLPIWREIEQELAALPAAPVADNFETYSMSIMGPTLYRMFIRDYTIIQWGRDPGQLSSAFAPSRFELRRDGDRRLFHYTWEFFVGLGAKPLVDKMTAGLDRWLRSGERYASKTGTAI